MSLLRQPHASRKTALGAVAIAMIFLLVGMGTSWADITSGSDPAPTISSDRADYAAGETVVLSGENWQPGESVQIDVEDSEGKTWTHQLVVTADEQGHVRDEFVLPNWFVAVYNVTATGEASGSATTTFTDGNVFVKNASTVPAGVAVEYKLERWNNKSNCAGGVSTTSNFTITGPGATSITGSNSVSATDKDSVRVTFVGAPSGYAFEEWHAIDKSPNNSVGEDGVLDSKETSLCVNVTDSNIARSYVGFLKVTATAPVAKAGADQTVDEDSAVNLDGSSSTGATSYSWKQLTGTSVALTGAATATPSFTAPDGPATLTFELKVSNSAGNSTDEVQVSVENVAPTVTLSGANTYSVQESATAQREFTYSASDPAGAGDTLTPEFDCGTAGSYVSGSGTATSFKCSFPDGANPSSSSTVKVTVKDGDGGSGSDSHAVTIANVAPTVTLDAGNTYEFDESGTAQREFTYSATDPAGAGDTLTPEFDCGTAGSYVSGSGTATSFKCSFANGTTSPTVKVTVKDGDGGSSSNSHAVTIENVAPTVEVTGPETVDEGSTQTYTYSVVDPGADTPEVSLDCGTGGTFVPGSDTGSGFDCTFGDGPGSSTVEVTADDGDDEGSDTVEVTIENVDPTVELEGPASADEGEDKNYVVTANDPVDSLTITPSCGENGSLVDDKDGKDTTFRCHFPDGPAKSTVSVVVDDGDGGKDSASTEVEVANVAPSGDAGGPYSGAWGNPIKFNGTATDPAGASDTLTYEWDFDYDGVTFDVDGTGVSPSNTYATPGSYTAAMKVSDEDGGADSIRTASVTVGKHATGLTYSGDSSVQYSDPATLKATLLDGSTPVAGKTIKFEIGSQTAEATTDSNGVASTTLVITQANGSYEVKSSFAGDSLYGAAEDSDPFTIKQENAGATYTGDFFAQTSSTSSGTATVVLSATIKDITALVGDPAYDAYAGEIPFAKVTFVVNGSDLSECSNLPVGLVSLADSKIGTATCNWKANIGSKDSEAFTIGIKVGGRYIRYESGDNTVVTVSRPIGTNFITGGGYLVNQKSAGQKAGGVGEKTNFGFNVKYNKAGTNLQGNINTIIRNAGRVYQIKGNSMTSLYVAPSSKPSATKPATATFSGKASIQDITNPADPQGVDGNATLQVVMTDKGEPGSADTIGITVWNKAGGLWFSSSWDSTKTIEQLLGGGNLAVR